MAKASIPLQAGQRFHRLTFIETTHVERTFPSGTFRRLMYRCSCDCGRETLVGYNNLTQGKVKSCGCLHREVIGMGRRTHGLSNSPEYHVWCAMKNRCLNPKDAGYANYGGRGITVCDRWRDSFDAFYADMGPRPDPKAMLERVDNDAGYGPSNCVWDTRSVQNTNKRLKTHCKRGHKFTEANTYRRPGSPQWRDCRICRRIAKEQRKHQR